MIFFYLILCYFSRTWFF